MADLKKIVKGVIITTGFVGSAVYLMRGCSTSVINDNIDYVQENYIAPIRLDGDRFSDYDDRINRLEKENYKVDGFLGDEMEVPYPTEGTSFNEMYKRGPAPVYEKTLEDK
jgi:hypothetical protein